MGAFHDLMMTHGPGLAYHGGMTRWAVHGVALSLVSFLIGCPGTIDRGGLDGSPPADQGQGKDRDDLGSGHTDGKPAADLGGKKADSKPWPTPDSKPWPTPDKTPWPTADSIPGADDIGKTCTSNNDCIHKLCAQNTHTGKWFCTKSCNPCTANPCPTGSGCQNAGPFYICAPNYPNAPCPKP